MTYLVRIVCFLILMAGCAMAGEEVPKLIPGLGIGISDLSLLGALLFTIRWFMSMTEKSFTNHQEEREREGQRNREAAAIAVASFTESLKNIQLECKEEQKLNSTLYLTMMNDHKAVVAASLDRMIATYDRSNVQTQENKDAIATLRREFEDKAITLEKEKK